MLGPVALFEDFQENPNCISQCIITSKAYKELEIPEELLLRVAVGLSIKEGRFPVSRTFFINIFNSLFHTINHESTPKNQSKQQLSTCPEHTSQLVRSPPKNPP